jgi:hypothetical protein
MDEESCVMMATGKNNALISAVVIGFVSLTMPPAVAASTESQVINREIQSDNLAASKIGTNPTRKIAVYLPAGYDESPQRYPVIYYLPNPLEPFNSDFEQKDFKGIMDRAIARGAINKFVLVSVDMSTSLGCSWYVNSPVTGNWEDFMIRDLVPYVDANFKTMAHRDSRGIVGSFMGGYGAIRFGMRYPNVFGTVYALHPVGTGSGIQIMHARPNWDLLSKAKSLDDLHGDGLSTIFTSIFQANLPDTERAPLFVDLPAHKVGGELVIDTQLTERLRNNFFLESMIPAYAENLKTLRGLKFDWGRSDGNQDHVYSNQAFTHKLNEFGIPHEAEEYNGGAGEGNWGQGGRVSTEVLPFFQRHLVFDATADSGNR